MLNNSKDGRISSAIQTVNQINNQNDTQDHYQNDNYITNKYVI